jgi:predicted sulfurtransferase
MNGKILKQAGIILAVCIFLALAINFVSPNGIPLMFDESRYTTENSDKMKNDFVNNQKNDGSTNGPTSMVGNPNKTKEGYIKPQNIKVDFAKILYDKNALFIDARPVEEYNAGHIDKAINIPYKEFMELTVEQRKEKMKDYNKDGIIVCYCNGGECEMSIDLAYEIAKIGFNSVNIYLGGYKEWEAAGHPVKKP